MQVIGVVVVVSNCCCFVCLFLFYMYVDADKYCGNRTIRLQHIACAAELNEKNNEITAFCFVNRFL